MKQSENTGAQVWDDDGGGGNGWTQQAYNRFTSGRDQETAVYTKTLGATETNPTFTWNTGGTNEPMSCSLEVYRSSISGAQILLDDLGYAVNKNDSTPPNPSVIFVEATSSVVCCHNATHDDISSPAPPTGFTMRGQVWAGTANDHRNIFVADLLNTNQGIGAYTPPDWQHSVLNNTPEYQTYTALLREVTIGIDDQGDEQLDSGDTNEIIDGFGFEAVQGTGFVEIGDDADYAAATKVTQTIDSWSDTQIQFDLVDTGFADGAKWVFVTNDSGERSAGYRVNYGNPPYGDVLNSHNYDIIHSFDNAYADTGARNGGYTANGQVTTNPVSFKAQSGVPGGNTHCWGPDSATGKIEMSDTPWTNVTNQHGRREIIGWIKLPAIPYKVATVVWEEGGGVNNIYFALGPGNALFFNVADSNGAPAFKVQAYADFTLTPNRWYHIRGILECGVGIQGVELRIDNIVQSVSAGDLPITDTTMSTHSGDYAYGDADGNLDTGGTDIAYAGSNGMLYAWWATASDSGGGAPISDADRELDFILGAPETDLVLPDTEANMQTAMDAIAPVSYSDVSLALKISRVNGGGNLRLELDSVEFDGAVSAQVFWFGTAGETLTLVNNGASNVDASKCFSPYGGSVVIENPLTLTIESNFDMTGAEVRLYDADATGTDKGTELDGVEVNPTSDFSTGAVSAGNLIWIQIIQDGFEEFEEQLTVGSADQTFTANREQEVND